MPVTTKSLPTLASIAAELMCAPWAVRLSKRNYLF
jgi:hypothetical protein